MNNHDWGKFEMRIPVYTNIQTVYDAWTTSAGLEKWFLRKAKFVKPDGTVVAPRNNILEKDTYEWFWHGWSDDVVERGTVLDANGKDFFKFIFGKAGFVSVVIKTEEDATIVELTQENIPTDEDSKFNFYLGCSTGWTFYLTNLKSILEGGLDLRNKNVLLKKVLNS
jgi:uncharacterized protein YndB with AHSA1/START domain